MTVRRVLLLTLVVLVVGGAAAWAVTGRTTSDASAPSRSAVPVVVGTSPAAVPTAAPPNPTASPRPTRTAAIDDRTSITARLDARVSSLRAVEGVGRGPGEVSGPAVRVVLRVHNGTKRAVDLSDAVVGFATGADAAPAPQLQSDGRPFPASVAPGETATGVFLFSVPADARKTVRITLDVAVGTPLIAFEGSAPR